MHKKSIMFAVVILLVGSMFSACALTKSDDKSNESSVLEDKNTEIEIEGRITFTNPGYFITDSSNKMHEIETYTLDFSPYVGKSVKVIGQYSGNTLFVSQIILD